MSPTFLRATPFVALAATFVLLLDPAGAQAPPGCDPAHPFSEECAQDKRDYDPVMTTADERFKANILKVDVNANVEVIGGDLVKGQFPEVVTLTGATTDNICSGVVIAPRLVVTAKHCLQAGVGKKGTRARFGDDYQRPSATIEVADAIAMPSRTNDTSAIPGRGFSVVNVSHLGTDIALVKLAADAPAKPVPLAGDARVKANAAVRVVGFGHDERKNFGKKLTARLIIASWDCGGSVKPKGAANRLADEGFYGCAKVELVAAGRRNPDTNLSADTCNGDSGGPAYVAPADSAFPAEKFERAFERQRPAQDAPRFALAAITSRGIKTAHIGGALTCGQGGVYTRISGDVLKWVAHTAKDKWKIALGPPQ